MKPTYHIVLLQPTPPFNSYKMSILSVNMIFNKLHDTVMSQPLQTLQVLKETTQKTTFGWCTVPSAPPANLHSSGDILGTETPLMYLAQISFRDKAAQIRYI